MKSLNYYNYPQKIICLTEESVETLFLLGEQHRISGVSAFVKRPQMAQKLPKVSFFTTSNYDKIKAFEPDLILGYSDIQKDIAKDLIELGYNVFIANHRTILGIFSYIKMLGAIVGQERKCRELLNLLDQKIAKAQAFASTLKSKPIVYFEEWDEPAISCIGWVCEILELCGAKVLFSEKSSEILARDRIIDHKDLVKLNPDIIFGCWCGKKVKVDAIKERENWSSINAVANNQVYELEPEIFLQPGPAPILDGLDIIIKYFETWDKEIIK